MTPSTPSEVRALAQAIPTLAPGADRRAQREAARLGQLWTEIVEDTRWSAAVTRIDVELGVATLAVHPEARAAEGGDNCWWDYRFDHFLKRWAESSVPTEVTCLLREALRERHWPETVIFSQCAVQDGSALPAEERVAPDAVVVVGEELMAFDGQISSCARAVGAHTRLHRGVDSAQAELSRGRLQPRCILIDARSPDGGAFVGWLRDQVRFFDVPVIALADEVSDGDFIATAELGADDALVPGELGRALTRRLAALERYVPGSHPRAAGGTVLLVHPDAGRRRLLGRVLRNAGFELRFADGLGDLAGELEKCQAKVVVASAALSDADGWRRALAAVGDRPLVLLGADAELAGLKLPRTAHAPDGRYAGPLLFQVSELLRSHYSELRASPRMVHTAVAAFRPTRELVPAYGLVCNISRDGAYVRTLDAPARGERVWLEYVVPGRDEPVRLLGEVMWQRSLEHGSSGATPPGFGLRFLGGGDDEDLALHRAFCDAIAS